MKNSKLFAYILALLLGITANCHAGWQLYDDFNSDQIDHRKWGVEDSSALITVENGQAKFVHQEGHPNDSSWLFIIQNPESIKGVKATIKVISCSGDVRVRMASFVGKVGNDYVWSELALRPDMEYISTSLLIVGPAPGNIFKSHFLPGGRFEDLPVRLNSPYTLSMILSLKNANYTVNAQDELKFTFPYTLSPTDDLFKGIGTHSSSGTGTCTVYFDDVYVFKQLVFPSHNLLLMED